MIPTIEEILSDLMAGRITYTHARALISRHMEIAEQSGLGDLRDEFAGQAMQGMLANQHPYQASDEQMFARDAYVLADAMLKARVA